MDANDPDSAGLLRYINLPLEWQTRTGSGFDTFMCEGFRYGGVNHNLDQANRSAAYPFTELSWDRAHCRYLMGLYLSGWPWQREYLTALVTRIGRDVGGLKHDALHVRGSDSLQVALATLL